MINFLITFVKEVKKVVKYLIARRTRKSRYSRVASKGSLKSYMGVYTFEARTRGEAGGVGKSISVLAPEEDSLAS